MDCVLLRLIIAATRHWNSTGRPNNLHGRGLTLTEYTAHYALWARGARSVTLGAFFRLSTPQFLPHDAEIRTP